MPTAQIDDTLQMYYEFDNFVAPWRTPETILLVHGVGGCAAEWFAWVPPLSEKYAVLRVDLRGWGQSTVPPEGYPWSLENFGADLKKLLDKLGLQKVHMVGTKLGGRIAIPFALDYPDRLHSMTLVSTPMTLDVQGGRETENPDPADGQEGVERWARQSMKGRVGGADPERLEWWIRMYGRNSPRVVSEVFEMSGRFDLTGRLAGIRVPTLVIGSEAYQGRPLEGVRKWQALIPDSRLAVIAATPDGGRQISASKPKECASALLEFLEELSSRRKQ